MTRREPCYACGRPLRGRGRLVGCKDDQAVYVGSDCFRMIRNAGTEGYQPPRGGPRLYLLEFTRHAHLALSKNNT